MELNKKGGKGRPNRPCRMEREGNRKEGQQAQRRKTETRKLRRERDFGCGIQKVKIKKEDQYLSYKNIYTTYASAPALRP